ncbi:hypothetical protein C8R44DRAFT_751016 [Mycena epipterygia]|nr:hypothetical protein C8R44DRAFT_751016 [Mycena epipterygia]
MPSIPPTPPLLRFRLPLQTPMPAVEELGQAQRALTPGISSAVPPRPLRPAEAAEKGYYIGKNDLRRKRQVADAELRRHSPTRSLLSSITTFVVPRFFCSYSALNPLSSRVPTQRFAWLGIASRI